MDTTPVTTTSSRRAIFIDVDGTLLLDGRYIPDSAIEAIHRARANGHLVFLSTGRAMPELLGQILDIGFDGVVSNGGAFATIGDELIVSQVMPQDVVVDVSLTIEPGETVAFVGASGSGKSTIGALMARVWDPRRGRVLLGGFDERMYVDEDIRPAVTLVPQRPFLFSGTLRANLLLANPEASERELREACVTAGLVLDSVTLPDGLDTVVGEFGGGVSGGQRQRIALARALVRGSRVLILDEVTSDLDPETEHLVAENLRSLTPARTLVFIAHRPTTALLASRVFVIDAGRVVESGPPDELLAAGGAFAALMAREG